jgi:iron complex outermembrane receptor protein
MFKNVRRLIAFWIVINLPFVALATPDDYTLKGNCSGKVTDAQTGQPLEGVTIYIADLKLGTSTDAKGVFTIKNIAEGKHLVEVSHIGYSTIAKEVDIKADTKIDFQLSETVVENNAVIITGVGSATQLKNAPYQVAVLRRQDLVQNASTNIIDALTKKPGISALSTGPAIAKPVIRGLGYNRVLTINDGVRQEGQQWGDEHGIEIDEASVQKIEIVKGPASVMYGSDAMAGVINIITNTPVENNTMKADVNTGYLTNNRQRLMHLNWGGNANGVNWNLYSSSSAAADYKNKYDGYVFNSKFRQQNFGGYAGYNGNWGYSHLLFSNFNLKTGMVEGERDEEGYFVKAMPGGAETRATKKDFTSSLPQVPYQHIRHFKIATDNNIKLGNNRLALNIGYQRNRRQEFGNADAPDDNELYFDLKTITYAAKLVLQEKMGWKTTVGANGMNQRNTNRGDEQIIPDYTLNDIGGFIYSAKTIDKITLSGGLRFDNRQINAKGLMHGEETKSPAFTSSFANVSGSIGMSAALSNHINLKLNLARAFRAPSLAELASNGAHEGTNRYEYGNLSLKSETSLQADAGIEFNTEHVSFSLAAYHNSFSNFIFYRKLSAANGTDSLVTDGEGNQLTAFTFDQRKATLSGLEATIDIHPHPLDWLHILNTFSYVSGSLKQAIEGSKNLPFIPAPRLLTEIRGDFRKLEKSIRNFYVKLELDNTFDQDKVFTAYNTETATPGYTLLNAGLGADIVTTKGNTLFSIHFYAANITDVAYQNHLSRLKYTAENLASGRTGVFNMGRNFSIKLNIPLSYRLKEKSS